MDIYKETKEPLQAIWTDGDKRQKSKLVIMTAIGNASESTVKVANDILDELDRLLAEDTSEQENQVNRGL